MIQYEIDARKVIEGLLPKTKELLGIEIAMPNISFNLRGIVAGRAVYRFNLIKLNLTLFKENYDDFISQTIPHEFAHLVARKINPDCSSHGSTWKAVMRKFGLEPKRCHSYDTSNSCARKTPRFSYLCKCRSHNISGIKHHRIQLGIVYRCKLCREPIYPQ